MFAPNFTLIVMLLCLLMAGLIMAKWALEQQNEQYLTLEKLSALDRRRQQTFEISRALQQMDLDSDVLNHLYSVLLDDIARILRLDPTRTDLEQQRKAAETGRKQKSGNSRGDSAAVATDQELKVVQSHINNALQLFTDLYKSGRISASQFEAARDELRTLGLRVSVNSSLLMAQRAIDAEDGIRAMACFRRAESLLGMRGLPAQEKQEKLDYVKQERERLFASRDRGLLMLASGD